jgi:hypothetical protein
LRLLEHSVSQHQLYAGIPLVGIVAVKRHGAPSLENPGRLAKICEGLILPCDKIQTLFLFAHFRPRTVTGAATIHTNVRSSVRRLTSTTREENRNDINDSPDIAIAAGRAFGGWLLGLNSGLAHTRFSVYEHDSLEVTRVAHAGSLRADT